MWVILDRNQNAHSQCTDSDSKENQFAYIDGWIFLSSLCPNPKHDPCASSKRERGMCICIHIHKKHAYIMHMYISIYIYTHTHVYTCIYKCMCDACMHAYILGWIPHIICVTNYNHDLEIIKNKYKNCDSKKDTWIKRFCTKQLSSDKPESPIMTWS